MEYKIPQYPPVGWWKLQVLTYSQIEEYSFLVEKFYLPRYEIDVLTPEFLVSTEETLSGEIGAAYLAEGQIIGNVTLTLKAEGPDPKDESVIINEEFIPYVSNEMILIFMSVGRDCHD